MRLKTHETLKKVSDDYARRYTFNTAIAAVMELTNAIGKLETRRDQDRAVIREAIETIVLMLSPITPHVCQKLWSKLGHSEPVIDATWPAVDESALEKTSVQLVVQVNGKVRGKINVSPDAPQDDIQALALGNENVQKFTEGKTIRKVIVVPGKLVSVVIG